MNIHIQSVGETTDIKSNDKKSPQLLPYSFRKSIMDSKITALLCTGKPNELQTDLKEWNNIVQVASGYSFCVGLDSNGNVIASDHYGEEYHGTCELDGFSNISMISCDDFYTVGLKADGTLKSTGSDYYGKCKVSGLRLFSDPQASIQSLNEQIKR